VAAPRKLEGKKKQSASAECAAIAGKHGVGDALNHVKSFPQDHLFDKEG